MKTSLAVLSLLLTLSPKAFAQVPLVDPQQLADLKKALADANAAAAAKKAADAKKPKLFADKRAIKDLTERLDRDGLEGSAGNGWGARTYLFNGQPDKSGAFFNQEVTLFERDLPSPTSEDGSITFTVMLKELSHLQAVRQTYTPVAGGRAKVEDWKFRVELDGRVSSCTKMTRTGKVVGPGTISAEPKDGYTEKEEQLEPASPAAREAWKRLESFLPFMGLVVEA